MIFIIMLYDPGKDKRMKKRLWRNGIAACHLRTA